MVIRGNSTLSITLPKMCEVKSTLRTRSLGFNSTISTGTAMSNLCTPGESYSYLQVTREVHRVFASTLDYSEDSLDSHSVARTILRWFHARWINAQTIDAVRQNSLSLTIGEQRISRSVYASRQRWFTNTKTSKRPTIWSDARRPSHMLTIPSTSTVKSSAKSSMKSNIWLKGSHGLHQNITIADKK